MSEVVSNKHWIDPETDVPILEQLTLVPLITT